LEEGVLEKLWGEGLLGCFGLVEVQQNVVEDVLPQLLLGETAGWERLG
jgi:hypothetical protein